MYDAGILSFGLKNVKSFKDTGNIDIKPITVFVGPNILEKAVYYGFLQFFRRHF